MATKTRAPAEGDRVIHHGRPHEIARVKGPIAVFENERFRVTAALADLQYSEADQAWYLPGRLLARNERALAEALTGSWPPAENHVAVRSMLDAVDLDTVSRPKLRRVLRRRKDELKEADQAAVESYADACLAQCAELRSLRTGD